MRQRKDKRKKVKQLPPAVVAGAATPEVSTTAFGLSATIATWFCFLVLMILLLIKMNIEKEALLARIMERDAQINDLEMKFSNPDEWREVAKNAFKEAEDWRRGFVYELYADMTDEDWDTASRWKSYAYPFAANRTCELKFDEPLRHFESLSALRSEWITGTMSELQMKSYVTNYTYHSTGLEGNTLTLPETILVVDRVPLFSGFPDDKATPSTGPSITEVRNLQAIMMALGFIAKKPCCTRAANISLQWLVDTNCAVTWNLDIPCGFRERAVAVGHQKVLLPMPDELDALMKEYEMWLLSKLSEVRKTYPNHGVLQLRKVLGLACDAHTKFVHIHPFADGNGRTARLIAGEIFKEAQLPPPIIDVSWRKDYMKSVGNATIHADYTSLCDIFSRAALLGMETAVRILRT